MTTAKQFRDEMAHRARSARHSRKLTEARYRDAQRERTDRDRKAAMRDWTIRQLGHANAEWWEWCRRKGDVDN